MSGIAEVLLNLGYQISGSDVKLSPITERLAALVADRDLCQTLGRNARVFAESRFDVTAIPTPSPQETNALYFSRP